MSRSYKLLVEAQCTRQKEKGDPLTQAELQDFFEETYRFGREHGIIKGEPEREFLSWEGEARLSGGITEQEYHNKIKESLQEQTEAPEGDLKVKTSWLELDYYTQTIGDAI